MPGILLTHLSVSKVIPAIGDLPKNIVKGFDEVFKFKDLEADSGKIKVESKEVVETCGRDITWCSVSKDQVFCTPDQQLIQQQAAALAAGGNIPGNIPGNVPGNIPGGGRRLNYPACSPTNTAKAKSTIERVFATTLNIVERVTTDKYFGTKDLQSTADNLVDIQKQLEKVKPLMDCSTAVPLFCEMYSSSDSIVNGMAEVNKAIDTFKKSDLIKQWDDNKGFLTVLHALPYFMVIALVSITFFWYKRGVCCCCEGGTYMGCCFLPFYVFWLVSFIIYAIVLGVGTALRYASNSIEVPVLKGKPKLDEAIDHMQTKFPEFWKVVFADLEDGLSQLWDAAVVFTLIALCIFVYSNALCCCRPYKLANNTLVVDIECSPGQQAMGKPQVK